MYGLNILPYDSSFPGLPNRTGGKISHSLSLSHTHTHTHTHRNTNSHTDSQASKWNWKITLVS